MHIFVTLLMVTMCPFSHSFSLILLLDADSFLHLISLHCITICICDFDFCSVLFSFCSHNMDQTDTFMLEATDFFISENLNRYIRGLPLLNPVDPIAGY